MAANVNAAIIDSSYLLCFLLPDEQNTQVEAIFNQYFQGNLSLIAPALLPYEVMNGLKAALIQKRIDEKTCLILADKFLELDIEYKEPDYLAIISMITNNKTTFYDTSYLYLSQTNNIPLLTLDTKLAKLV